MTKIAVTGGSGRSGHAIISHLLDHGFDCLNLDVNPPRHAMCPSIPLDLTDYQATFDALDGVDALVHFAGNPDPDFNHLDAAERFSNNTLALFNAFNAARERGIKRVVWASSETIFGFPFEESAPDHLPLTETAPRQPQNGYALSKAISEDLADMMAQLYGMTFIGFRLSNILYDDPEAEPSFQKIPGYWQDRAHRKFNLWGYVDSRDTAEAVRLALIADITGSEIFNIVAPDTLMQTPSRELVAEFFPNATMDQEFGGFDGFLSGDKARRILGFEPRYLWCDVLGIKR